MELPQDTGYMTQGATAEEETIELADDFSDLEELRVEGISLPPTREDIRKLLIVGDGKYTDELVLIQGNYNSRQENREINYDEIKRILTKEFNLYRLRSNPGEPYTNSRGDYLARIRGDRDVQRKRIRKICKQIKHRLLSSEKVNISKAHIVASLVLYYGDEEDTPQAATSGRILLPPGQQPITNFMTPCDDSYLGDTGYGQSQSQNSTLYTPEPTPEPGSGL